MDFIDFLLIWGTHSESFFGTFGQKKQFFSYLFPGCFFCWFVGLNLGVWDWKNMDLALEVLQNMILGGLGTNFHGFCCPGDWLEN